jgi:flagellar biosynthesis protein
MNRNDNRPPFAVALHYRNERARAVAEGEGLVAERIMARARAQGVPLQQDAALAGALAKLELHEAIPRELYIAVAEILKFLWELDRSPHSEPTLLSQDSSPGPDRP